MVSLRSDVDEQRAWNILGGFFIISVGGSMVMARCFSNFLRCVAAASVRSQLALGGVGDFQNGALALGG